MTRTMTTDPSGGSAFPLPDSYTSMGMTLWDYYAAHALQGLLAREPQSLGPEFLAMLAGQYAEALLKERENHVPPHWLAELHTWENRE